MVWCRLPRMESDLSRWASVAGLVRSFTATNSISGLPSAARNTLRPIRPKPLMPPFTAINFGVSLGGEVWKAGLENCSASHRWLSIFPNGVKRRKGTLRRRFVKERLPVATLTTPRVCENALSAKDECTKERAPEMGAGHLLRCRKLCYIHIMREWMRALMRRRGKRGVNDSESTGKIGQEIPANQPTPLQPMYPEDKRGRAPEPAAAEQEPDAAAQLVKKPARAPEPSVASAAVE